MSERGPVGLSAVNQHGEWVVVADRPTLLVFFPYAFTGICTDELTALRDHHAAFEAAGVRVLGCSCDSMFALRVFADTERLGFDLVSDHWPHGRLARAYGAFDEERGCAERATFLLDASGRTVWSQRTDIGTARSLEDALAAVRNR